MCRWVLRTPKCIWRTEACGQTTHRPSAGHACAGPGRYSAPRALHTLRALRYTAPRTAVHCAGHWALGARSAVTRPTPTVRINAHARARRPLTPTSRPSRLWTPTALATWTATASRGSCCSCRALDTWVPCACTRARAGMHGWPCIGVSFRSCDLSKHRDTPGQTPADPPVRAAIV